MIKVKKDQIIISIQKIIVTIIWFFTIFILLMTTFNIIYIRTPVVGFSMQPTLNATVDDPNEKGDYVYINRFFLGQKNDIVVADVSWNSQYIIKRVVATAGDKLKIYREEDTLYLLVNSDIFYTRSISDTVGDENYGNRNTYENFLDYKDNNSERFDENGFLVLTENELYILGDNWAESYDCSSEGPIQRDNLIGRVDIVIKREDSIYVKLLEKLFDVFKISKYIKIN